MTDSDRSARALELEQLIAALEGNVLNWLRVARSADPAAALGYRELAADDLVIAIEYSRRLARMTVQQQRIAQPAGR